MSPYPHGENARMAKKRPDGKKPPHGPVRMAKKPSGWQKTSAWSLSAWQKSCQPCSNRVAAPKVMVSLPQACCPKACLQPLKHAQRCCTPCSTAVVFRRSPTGEQKCESKPSHQSPSLQPLPFSAASSEKSSPRCLPS